MKTLRLERRAPRWMFWVEASFPKLAEGLGRRWLMKNRPGCGCYNLAPGGQFRATNTEPVCSFDLPITCKSGVIDIVE